MELVVVLGLPDVELQSEAADILGDAGSSVLAGDVGGVVVQEAERQEDGSGMSNPPGRCSCSAILRREMRVDTRTIRSVGIDSHR